MRSVITRYPSSVFQAQILREAGFRVVVCDITDGGHEAIKLTDDIERRVLEKVGDLFDGSQRGFVWKRLLSRRMFRHRLELILRELKPDLVLSYDPPAYATMASLLSGASKSETLHIWHCHEAAILSSDMGWGTRRDVRMAKMNARHADMVIVPDQDRLEVLFKDFDFSHNPFVVMNCPRRLAETPISKRLPELINRPDVAIVMYFGSVGRGHGLETALESMRIWPRHSVFCIVGPCSESYRRELYVRAYALGVESRVFIPGTVPSEQALGLRAGADIILTVMDTAEPIYRFCAGASNKRFEAMAVGRAQITNCGPGIDRLFVDRQVALAVPHDCVEATGSAVAWLLTNPARCQAIGANARRLHLESYNYESEFAPVLDKIYEKLRFQ